MKNGIKSFGNQAVDFPNERRKSTLNTGGKNPLKRNLWCNYFKKKGLKHWEKLGSEAPAKLLAIDRL